MSLANCEITKELVTLLASKFSSSLSLNTPNIYSHDTGTQQQQQLTHHHSHPSRLSLPSSFHALSTSFTSYTPLTAQDIAEIFLSLRNYSPRDKETLLLIDSLLLYLRRSSEKMNQGQFCIALSGLRNMTSESPLINMLLQSLLVKVPSVEVMGVVKPYDSLSITTTSRSGSSGSQVSFEKLCQAFYGIHHLNFSDPIVISVLSHLNDIHSLPPPRLIRITNRAFHRLFVSLRYISCFVR
jgi:hypothetical protein